jgi:hypothetical protein
MLIKDVCARGWLPGYVAWMGRQEMAGWWLMLGFIVFCFVVLNLQIAGSWLMLGFILFCFVVLNLQIPLPELADCHRTEMGYYSISRRCDECLESKCCKKSTRTQSRQTYLILCLALLKYLCAWIIVVIHQETKLNIFIEFSGKGFCSIMVVSGCILCDAFSRCMFLCYWRWLSWKKCAVALFCNKNEFLVFCQ